MNRADRDGLTLKTGKIGRVNCLRQQLLMPGEMVDIDINGTVRLETLRERDVMRINAHIGVFGTPLRWVWPEFTDFLKEGPDTLISPPTRSNQPNWAVLGIGSYQPAGNGTYYRFFEDAYLKCVNEWYKWPENDDFVFADIGDYGVPAVPLSKPWSRARYNMTPSDSADYNIDVSGATMDIRALQEIQARYRSAMRREVLPFSRWMELIKDVYKGDGSREVDQVPMMLDQADLGVNPREMPATDGASLGQWQSMFDFDVNHQIKRVIAPEHMIVTYLLTIRFASIIESCHPLATDRLDWHELTADPEFLSSAQPRAIERRDYSQSNSDTEMGQLAAGWQWRCGHDVIGKAIDIRNSFPYMEPPTTQSEAKDATRVKSAFRSQALDDYMVDIFIKENSRQPIGTAMDSYFAGMLDETSPRISNTSDEFPKGGKLS